MHVCHIVMGVAFGFLPWVATAQVSVTSVVQSYARARALLDTAVAVHGGAGALRSAGRFAVHMSGTDYWRNQSRRVDPPYDAEPWTGDLVVDAAQSRLIWTTTSHFPGGFHNAGRMIIDGSRALYVNYAQGVYVMTPGRTLDNQRDVLYRMPHLALVDALDNAAGLRWLGRMRLTDGTSVDAITTTTPIGQLTLGIDPATKELRALLGVQADPLVGDAATEIEFVGYTRSQTLLVPRQRVSRVAGEIVQDAQYTGVTLDPAIADSLLSPPVGMSAFTPLATADAPVRELAPGVWAIRSAGYWSLAVAFADYVLVVEAPAHGVSETMAQITSLAPGKPVRYVAVTHHHEDHAGGMRAYMAAGATILTTPGNRRFFDRMARAQSSLAMPPSGPLSGPARIETIVDGRCIVSDGRRTVELHDIGPSPHADEMLVAWLPVERVLFQGDLLNLPPNGAVLPGGAIATMTQFRDWVRRRGWDVKILAGVHMPPGSMAQLDEAIRQAAALAAPGV